MAGGAGRALASGETPFNASQDATEWAPSRAEEKLLEVLLDPSNRLRTIAEQCSIAGVDRATYYRAIAKPEFVSYMNAEAKQRVGSAGPSVLNAFIREAQKGSYTHGLIILEMAGLYTPRSRVEHTGANGGPLELQALLPRDEVMRRLQLMGIRPTEEAPDPPS